MRGLAQKWQQGVRFLLKTNTERKERICCKVKATTTVRSLLYFVVGF